MNGTAKPVRLQSPRTRWRALLAAQESGLVLVILAMVGILTWFGFVRVDDRVVIAADAQVNPLLDGGFVVNSGDEAETYPPVSGWNSRGWMFREARGERWISRRYIDFSVNRFLSRGNLVGIAKDASFIAVMAVGVMGIIILGGIDLSIGSVYALSAITGALALNALEAGAPEGGAPWYLSLPIGIGVCCLVGAACGAANGAAIVGLRVHPFIITLGGMAIYRGLAFVITQGQSVGDFPDSFTIGAFKARLLGANPVPMFIMLAVAILGWGILSRTVFGRQTYAIGGNETAARYAGIPVGRVKIAWYTLGGLLAGLSAAMLLGYYGAASSDAGPGYELKVIAAAVVGGASLSGGRGSAIGAMLGALVIQLIDNAIVVLGVNSNYTNIVIGLAIIIAVVVDQAKTRLTAA